MSASSWKIIAAAVVAGLGIVVSGAVVGHADAQQAAAAEQGGWGQEHHHMLPGQLIEARLAYLKTALQITPAQTTQWNAFADVLRKEARARDEMITAMRAKMDEKKDDKAPDLVTMMEHRQQMLRKASANVDERLAALKPLYASLSDSQKEIAAQVLRDHGHRGGWGHGAGR
jgi:protein CpxP